MTSTNGFVSWGMLRKKELSNHYLKIVQEWKTLLSNNALSEHAYLKYLHENAGFFFHDCLHKLISISEFEFGADLRADFVVCNDRASYGFEYEFVEIESPWDPVFTQKGMPSSRLTEAMNQVQRWRLWLDANRPEAKRVLPSKSFVIADQPAFKYTIIIGRRHKEVEWLHLRNQLAEQMNIEIRSFDYLTDCLLERVFTDAPLAASAEFDRLSLCEKNALANPFATSFRSAAWRTIVKSASFSFSHMIASNADKWIGAISHSRAHDECIEAWNALPDDVRQESYEEAKQWF